MELSRPELRNNNNADNTNNSSGNTNNDDDGSDNDDDKRTTALAITAIPTMAMIKSTATTSQQQSWRA